MRVERKSLSSCHIQFIGIELWREHDPSSVDKAKASVIVFVHSGKCFANLFPISPCEITTRAIEFDGFYSCRTQFYILCDPVVQHELLAVDVIHDLANINVKACYDRSNIVVARCLDEGKLDIYMVYEYVIDRYVSTRQVCLEGVEVDFVQQVVGFFQLVFDGLDECFEFALS